MRVGTRVPRYLTVLDADERWHEQGTRRSSSRWAEDVLRYAIRTTVWILINRGEHSMTTLLLECEVRKKESSSTRTAGGMSVRRLCLPSNHPGGGTLWTRSLVYLSVHRAL